MNAVIMHVHTDKDKSQMKAELKPLEDTSQKVETKSRNYINVVLGTLLCGALCVNVALAARFACKETCVTGVALLEEGQEVCRAAAAWAHLRLAALPVCVK